MVEYFIPNLKLHESAMLMLLAAANKSYIFDRNLISGFLVMEFAATDAKSANSGCEFKAKLSQTFSFPHLNMFW